MSTKHDLFLKFGLLIASIMTPKKPSKKYHRLISSTQKQLLIPCAKKAIFLCYRPNFTGIPIENKVRQLKFSQSHFADFYINY
jgi:hypothetical protein